MEHSPVAELLYATADYLARYPTRQLAAGLLTPALNPHRCFHAMGGLDGLVRLFPSILQRLTGKPKSYYLLRDLDRSTLYDEPELAGDAVLAVDIFIFVLKNGPTTIDHLQHRFAHPAMRLRPEPPNVRKLVKMMPSHFFFGDDGSIGTSFVPNNLSAMPLNVYAQPAAEPSADLATTPTPKLMKKIKNNKKEQLSAPLAAPSAPAPPAASRPKQTPVQIPTPASTPSVGPAPFAFAPAPVLPAAAAPVPAPFHPSTAAPAPAPPPAAAAVAAEGFLDAPVPRPLETDVDPTQVRDWIRKPLPLLVPVHARFDPENPARIQWRSAAVPPPPAPQNEDPEEAAFNARVRAEVEDLLALLPRDLYDRICEALPGNAIDELDEISLDLGMPPRLRFLDLDDAAADSAARAHDGVLDLDDFGPIAGRDNATPVGLTLRIGRAAPPHTGLATVLLRDLLARGESILVVGRPGTGKTHTLRDICARLSEGDKTSSSSFARRRRNVMIVDTSGEVGGPGDVAHPSLRRCRRMHVPSRARQHESMLEAVQNHTPDVVAVDEISNGREAHAARSVSTRVHAIVATVHGSLASVLRNRELRDIFGGITSSTVGDERAERELGGRKELVARASDAVFTAAVELVSRTEVRIVHNVNEFVDDLLDFNKSAWIERRRLVPGSSKTVFESTVEVYEDVRSDEIVG
ncbi:hypothetical protein H9P43_005512 [Blastocladiella emersonii ATCC 22665]|nr:hypothetical protein H9P43_005512 [Blastocladiella emersonii ATCC 22665]